MDHINLMLPDESLDIPPAVPDMQIPVPVVSRDQPIKYPHEPGSIEHMYAFGKDRVPGIIADDLIYLVTSSFHSMKKLRRDLFGASALICGIQI